MTKKTTSRILAAGGELVVDAPTVRRVGGGSYEKGHKILDEMIKRVREHTIKFLRHAPKPKT